MTEEKVKQGEKLLTELSRLKDLKNKWERACRFYSLEVADYKEYDGRGSSFVIDDSFINFEEVKLLTISKIDRRIREVQREFDEL